MENQYIDKELAAERLRTGQHRAFVGGRWDEIGQLQFDYMRGKGLAPTDRFVDVACGSMRGGRHFIGHLNPFHYFGFDINRELIDAGLTHEIAPLGLLDKVAPDNLVAAEAFEFPSRWRDMDSALALSLFTHLTMNSIALCLRNLRPVMRGGARFYATIFHVVEDAQTARQEQLDGIVTYMCQDPYHYTRGDMDYLAGKTGWHVVDIETFNHPRGQSMVIFETA